MGESDAVQAAFPSEKESSAPRFNLRFHTEKKKKMFTLLACKERIENEEIPSELLDVYKIQCKAEIDSAR